MIIQILRQIILLGVMNLSQYRHTVDRYEYICNTNSLKLI